MAHNDNCFWLPLLLCQLNNELCRSKQSYTLLNLLTSVDIKHKLHHYVKQCSRDFPNLYGKEDSKKVTYGSSLCQVTFLELFPSLLSLSGSGVCVCVCGHPSCLSVEQQ